MKLTPVEINSMFYFPVHGCEPARPLTDQEVEKINQQAQAAIRQHWDHEGVKAIIQHIEIHAAKMQSRAVSKGAEPHDAGQAYALTRLVGQLQEIRWKE
jgi:hypothetical protein